MAESKVWIQNGYRSAMEFIVKNATNNENESYVFGAYKVDRISGRVTDDGYTVLDKSTYEMLLEKSNAFKRMIDNGTLVVYDKAPLSAMSDVDRILALQEEVRTLKEENASLRDELAKVKKSGTKATAKTDVKATEEKAEK